MAPLEVIGAGFGRTGTDSLRTALNHLGYNTHHMRLVYGLKTQDPSLFREAYENPDDPIDWDKIYEGYNAAVDWPTCAFVKPLMEKYPNAKIILTVRDPDSWYKSMKNLASIHQVGHRTAENASEHARELQRMTDKILLDGAVSDPVRFADEKAIKDMFIKHNEWVMANVPPERLLVMQLGDGWEKLCPFLGKEIPDIPYPHRNSTEEMVKLLSISKNLDEICNNTALRI